MAVYVYNANSNKEVTSSIVLYLTLSNVSLDVFVCNRFICILLIVGVKLEIKALKKGVIPFLFNNLCAKSFSKGSKLFTAIHIH